MLMTIKHLCNYFDNKYTLSDRIYYYLYIMVNIWGNE